MKESLFRRFFGLKPKKPDPKIGETWFLDKGGPWPKGEFGRVKILDVREGWVRYAYPSIYTDERMKLRSFTDIFVKCEEP